MTTKEGNNDVTSTEQQNIQNTLIENKLSFFKNEPEVLKECSKNIFPVLIEIFLCSSNIVLRKLTVESVSKVIWWVNKLDSENNTNNLQEVIQNKDEFGKFVSELCALNNNDALLNGSLNNVNENLDYDSLFLLCIGLQLSSIVIERNNEYFQKMFIRDGLLFIIERILESNENITKLYKKLEQKSSVHEGQSSTIARKGFNEIKLKFIKKKRSFSNKYKSFKSSSSNKSTIDDNDLSVDVNKILPDQFMETNSPKNTNTNSFELLLNENEDEENTIESTSPPKEDSNQMDIDDINDVDNNSNAKMKESMNEGDNNNTNDKTSINTNESQNTNDKKEKGTDDIFLYKYKYKYKYFLK